MRNHTINVSSCVKQIVTILKEYKQFSSSANGRNKEIETLVYKINGLIENSLKLFENVDKSDHDQFSENIYILKLYEALMDLYIQSGHFKSAYDIAIKHLLPGYKYI